MVKFPYPYGIARFADRHHDVGLLFLRLGISAVLFYFGIGGLLDYNSTLSWIAPQIKSIISTIIPLKIFALVLTLLQTLVALLLLFGLFTRPLGLAGFFMMIGIIVNLFMIAGTVDDVIMRDVAIATADLALFFFGPGKYSLDRKLDLE